MSAFIHVWFADLDVNLLAFAGVGVVVLLTFELVRSIKRRQERRKRRRKPARTGLGDGARGGI
jgi:hypothetical protein